MLPPLISLFHHSKRFQYLITKNRRIRREGTATYRWYQMLKYISNTITAIPQAKARYAAHDCMNHIPAKAIMFITGKNLNILNTVSVSFGNFVRNSCLSVNSLYKAKQLPSSISIRNIDRRSGLIFFSGIQGRNLFSMFFPHRHCFRHVASLYRDLSYKKSFSVSARYCHLLFH